MKVSFTPLQKLLGATVNVAHRLGYDGNIRAVCSQLGIAGDNCTIRVELLKRRKALYQQLGLTQYAGPGSATYALQPDRGCHR